MTREAILSLYGSDVLNRLTTKYGHATLYWMTEIAIVRRELQRESLRGENARRAFGRVE